jgi:hypothetical protein
MSNHNSSILERINDLYEERRALWALTWRDEPVQARLAEIKNELEQLWNKRRLEKAGRDTDAMPDNIVYERDARFGPRARYRRGRAERREREVQR